MNYKDFSFLKDLKDYLKDDIQSIKVIRIDDSKEISINHLFILNNVSITLLDSMLNNYNYDYLKINLEYNPYENGYLLTIELYEKEGDNNEI